MKSVTTILCIFLYIPNIVNYSNVHGYKLFYFEDKKYNFVNIYPYNMSPGRKVTARTGVAYRPGLPRCANTGAAKPPSFSRGPSAAPRTCEEL